MRLHDSPSLEDYSDGLMTPNEPKKGKKGVWMIISVLSLFILVLLVVKVSQSELPAQIAGKGSLSGQAVNEKGEPIPVEVLVFETDLLVQSDQNGYFFVENIPSGPQSVIVAYGNIAAEIEVAVEPGTESSLGKVTVPTELLELVDE